MKLQSDRKLDNPVWHSLNENHKEFSLTYADLKCYRPDICPFGGYNNNYNISKHITEYAKLADNFFIVGEKPEFSIDMILEKELVCLQMIIDHKINLDIREEIIHLNESYSQDLFKLVNLVQPGYFKSKTILLGDYYGVFKNGSLIAAAGERMKMSDFTEVSAIVTHPDHTGKGYAKQLIAHVVKKISDENKVPYLHVADTNSGAIKLYNKLGFKIRSKISFWNFSKKYII